MMDNGGGGGDGDDALWINHELLLL